MMSLDDLRDVAPYLFAKDGEDESKQPYPSHQLVSALHLMNEFAPNLMETSKLVAAALVRRLLGERAEWSPAIAVELSPSFAAEVAQLELALLQQQVAKQQMEVLALQRTSLARNHRGPRGL